MEMLGFFRIYLLPIVLAMLAVIASIVINVESSLALWPPPKTDIFEVFGYALRVTGPFVFVAGFLAGYFVLEFRRDPVVELFRMLRNVSLAALVAALVLAVVFIPRSRY